MDNHFLIPYFLFLISHSLKSRPEFNQGGRGSPVSSHQRCILTATMKLVPAIGK